MSIVWKALIIIAFSALMTAGVVKLADALLYSKDYTHF